MSVTGHTRAILGGIQHCVAGKTDMPGAVGVHTPVQSLWLSKPHSHTSVLSHSWTKATHSITTKCVSLTVSVQRAAVVVVMNGCVLVRESSNLKGMVQLQYKSCCTDLTKILNHNIMSVCVDFYSLTSTKLNVIQMQHMEQWPKTAWPLLSEWTHHVVTSCVKNC